MITSVREQASPHLTLRAETAAELMTPNPVSIRGHATLEEAVALLTDKGFSAAPVVDQAGRPIGVLSRSDVLAHEREKVGGPAERQRRAAGVVHEDPTRAADIMTPAVFSVTPDTPARRVVQEMVALTVHRLFVVDQSGTLVGVISASDVLRQLR